MKSGTIQKSVLNGKAKIVCAWELTSQKYADLQSTIKITVSLSASSSVSFGGYRFAVAFNGSTLTDKTVSGEQDWIGAVTKTLYTTTKTITHASSTGAASRDIKVTFWEIPKTNSGITVENPAVELTGTIMPDTIPVATKPTVSVKSIDIGSSVTINLSKNLSSNLSTLSYEFGGASGSIVIRSSASSYTWTPPISLCSQLPDSTSGVCTITCATDDSNYTSIGEPQTVTLTLKVPASVVPTISNVTTTEFDSDVASKVGEFVQGKTKLNVSVSASGARGSTIEKYKTTLDGYVYADQSFTSQLLRTSGTLTLTTTVTDSRGRTATFTKDITVLAYAPPQIKNPRIFRGTSSTTPDDKSTTVYCVWASAFSPLNGKNKYYRRVRWKKTTDSAWTEGTLVTDTSTNTSISRSISGLALANSWDVAIEIYDIFEEKYQYRDLISAGKKALTLDRQGRGAALGKQYEHTDSFELGYALALYAGVDYTPNPWTTVAAFDDSAYSLYGTTSQRVRYRKIGNRVVIEGQFNVTPDFESGSTRKVLFTLPEGFRPKIEMHVLAISYSNFSYLLKLQINTSGRVSAYDMYSLTSTSTVSNLSANRVFSLTAEFYTD